MFAGGTMFGQFAGADSRYRDLNKNGRLDAYEDATKPVDERIDDLVDRMSVSEKAGQMFIYATTVNEDASIDYHEGDGQQRLNALTNIEQHKLSHFNLFAVPSDLQKLAKWQNSLQQYAAENSRLGIPVTIASDPRHHFSQNIFSFVGGGFSQFPETLGLAAIGDPELVDTFADIVREEYLAVGIRLALHPQVDLATEPRWPRINGGFGESAEVSAEFATRYIKKLQGNHLSSASVATMTKHFPGGGPQNEGLDPHFEFQRGQVYPGNNFDYHLIPFAAAIAAGTSAIMPYYGIPVGQTSSDVAMAFNKEIIGGLLRGHFAYEGIVCTDWGVITDLPLGEVVWPARAWGVEHLDAEARVKAALDAGVDQFGGERVPLHIVSLVESKQIDEARVDESVRRILRQKFELGLFDDPFVNVESVSEQVGKPASVKLGFESQMRAMTMLKNSSVNNGLVLPLRSGNSKIFVQGIDARTVEPHATVVDQVADADFAIIRINTPWYPVETDNPFARGFHHGDLDFKGSEKEDLLNLLEAVPTVVVIYLDRPAVIPDIVEQAAAVIAEYGASDEAVAHVLFGAARPEGKLPFELPSSMSAVEKQLPDVPADSERPLFETGFGLRYD